VRVRVCRKPSLSAHRTCRVVEIHKSRESCGGPHSPCSALRCVYGRSLFDFRDEKGKPASRPPGLIRRATGRAAAAAAALRSGQLILSKQLVARRRMDERGGKEQPGFSFAMRTPAAAHLSGALFGWRQMPRPLDTPEQVIKRHILIATFMQIILKYTGHLIHQRLTLLYSS